MSQAYLLRFLRWLSLHTPFIYVGVKYRLLRLILWMLRIKSFPFVVDFFGYKYEGNLKDYLDFHVYFFGSYETGILNLIVELVDQDSVVMDIGANTGHHSLFFSRHCRQVYAFEPYAPVRDALEKRLEINGVNNVQVFPIGLAEMDQVLEYHEPMTNNQGTGSFTHEYSSLNQGRGLKLNLRNGDSLIGEVGPSRVDFIKIDVEGFEDRVLQGISGTISKFLPSLIIEVSQKNAQLDSIRKLVPVNYDLFVITNYFSDKVNLRSFEGSVPEGYVLARPSRMADNE